MKVDPEAVWRCWPVDVDLAGQVWTIPALPARDWLLAVVNVTAQGLAGPLPGVVPGLIADDDLADLIADGQIRPDECVRAARDAVTAAAGMKWWTAIRIAHGATHVDLGGELAVRGVDPATWPFGAYLLAAYRIATRHVEDLRRAQVDAELAAPPVGVPGEDWWDQAEANAQFAAAMGSVGR